MPPSIMWHPVFVPLPLHEALQEALQELIARGLHVCDLACHANPSPMDLVCDDSF